MANANMFTGGTNVMTSNSKSTFTGTGGDHPFGVVHRDSNAMFDTNDDNIKI